MHPGLELVRLIKSAGGRLVAKEGHHETWVLGKKQYRVATAGKRPAYVFKTLHRQVASYIRQQDIAKRKSRQSKRIRTLDQTPSSAPWTGRSMEHGFLTYEEWQAKQCEKP